MAGTLVPAVWVLVGGSGRLALLRHTGLRFFLAQGRGNQLVGEHELGFADVVHRQGDGRAVDVDANRLALNATTGEPLWHANVASSVSNAPISYELDGRQFVVAGAGDILFGFVLNGSK